MKLFSSILSLFLLSSIGVSCQQATIDRFAELDYQEIYRGPWKDFENTVVFRNKFDTNYYFRKFYTDSLFSDSTDIVAKYFFINDTLDGPYISYVEGRITIKGYYKNNHRHGEFITFNKDGTIYKKAYYSEGKKSGIWEVYYNNGFIYKKIYYDENGDFKKQEIHDKNTGKLIRTELKVLHY